MIPCSRMARDTQYIGMQLVSAKGWSKWRSTPTTVSGVSDQSRGSMMWCCVPKCRATASASGVSSAPATGKRTLNVMGAGAVPVVRVRAATTSDESIPPESSAATGTSASDWLSTAATILVLAWTAVSRSRRV